MASIEELPDIDQAMQRLEAAEAAETSDTSEVQGQEAETKEEQQPVPSEKEAVEVDSKADEGTTEPVDKDKTPVKQEEDQDKNKSAYKKNSERLDKTWKSVNEQKAALAKEKEQIETQKQQIELQRKEIEAQRTKVERKYSPEQYDGAATQKLNNSKQLELHADGLDRRADQAEEKGDYDAAEKLRKESSELRENALTEKGMAKQLALYAKQLRDNPEPSMEQLKAKKADELKHYTIEASKVFPDLMKDGSHFQKRTAEHLNAAATKYGMDANEYPALMYFAAQMTHLEQQASQVPSMTKELTALRAKVKDYEKLNAPGGGSEASTNVMAQKARTDEDEASELRAYALQHS